ncbi:MAG: efflux RND transporter permease subunit [Planctomycetaceae bacterium]|nr:efflux RND transporter permease subunit [Planctomycetales bacterium]MCB9923534.1 efflux RND transporter permease subunit [Planctomycetaceae bacterium]
MSLSAWAMKYRPIVLTMVSLLMVWGIASYYTMPRREDPEYTVRTCAITTVWPGAPAEKVEELVTKPLEEAVDRIDDVKRVYSTTKTGLSTIFVDAEDNVSPERIDNVWDKVRAYVSRVQMPEATVVPSVNDEYGDTSIILIAVYQTPLPGETEIKPENTYTLRDLDVISEAIKDELRLLDGVAKSEQFGVVSEAIYIETSMGTWSQLQLTADQLKQLAEARNIVAPGGTIDTPDGRFSVKPGGEFNALKEMKSVIAGLAGQDGERGGTRPVMLSDLGLDIVRDYEDPRQIICRFGDAEVSRPAVIVALTMKSGANIVTICEAAKARLAEMEEYEQAIPPDIGLALISDQSENVNAKIGQVLSNVAGAIIIVVVVVYLIVGFRSAAVMAANIPIVVLAALALITMFGVQLEQISLASIIIALGLLVDNAVQVCDQSRSNQISGMRPDEATIVGSNQVATPMLMGTATTIAAFAPMLIALEGNTQEYIYSLPITLSVTLGISWFLAMTFCTILAAAFIRAPRDPNRPSAPVPWLIAKFESVVRKARRRQANDERSLLDSIFRSSVRAAIDFKFVTVAVAAALFIAAITLPVASEFFPKDLRDQFAIKIWLPDTSTIQETNAVAMEVEEMLRKLSPTTNAEGNQVEQIRAMRTMVGGGGTRWYLSWNPEPRTAGFAEILVRTTDARYTPHLAKRVREAAEQGDSSLGITAISGARVIPHELFLGPSKDPVEIRISGPGFADMNTLRRFADRIKAMILATEGTWDVYDVWGVAGYQLRVDIDEDKANRAGVTNLDIAKTLNAYYSGHHLTTFREGDHTVPVYLRLRPEERQSLEGLRTAFVEGQNGKVPLNSIATIVPRWEPAKIERRNLNRVIQVRSQVEEGVSGNDVVKNIMKSEAMKQLESELPSGYRVEVGGNLEESERSSSQLALSLGISVLSIVLLLVIQYNGWAKPVIILTTLPLALIGALPGLWLTDNALGFMPQLGILSLFGIVLNTGIIFMEFADILVKEAAERENGSGPIHGLTQDQFRNCLVEAGQQRFLPIFLTTATTIGGLLPLALDGGPLWEGMAWCMIFGLIIATLLTLLVVPALYAIMVEHLGVKVFHKA